MTACDRSGKCPCSEPNEEKETPVSKYVLLYQGFVLPKIEDEEAQERSRTNRIRRRVVARNGTSVGHKPLANLQQVTGTRVEWAAALGGAIGSVTPKDIQVARLVLINTRMPRKCTRVRGHRPGEARQYRETRRREHSGACHEPFRHSKMLGGLLQRSRFSSRPARFSAARERQK